MGRIEDILNSGPAGMKEFVGRQVLITAAEFGESNYGPNVRLTFTTEDDDQEHSVTTGAEAIFRKMKVLAEEDNLPVSAIVTTYPGQFGNDGYDLRAPE